MAIRNYSSQSLHDRVIHVAASKLNKWKVYINPGQQKNAQISNLYPDIILADLSTHNIEFIIEIETYDSVNANEATLQWARYSNLPGTFYILVPVDYINVAKSLCRENSIQASFGSYTVNFDNSISIMYE